MQKVIVVKRDSDKNAYYFLDDMNLNVGDKVVVQLDEFQTVCEVTKIDFEIADHLANEFGKILRKATESDIKKYESLKKKAKSELPLFKKKSLELGLMMKFVSAEYSLDNSKIMITFSSEERVDFRQLLKELASMLKTRIELRQIGQRDEIKVCGGVGPCGEPCCCARFLKEFDHVTVKMAKIQGLSLSPTKINGICGRLMCCLAYESASYEEMLSKMPKVGSEVTAPNGKGVVVFNDILRERVSVKRQAENDTFVVEDFALDEIEFAGKPASRAEKLPKEKAEKVAEDIIVEEEQVDIEVGEEIELGGSDEDSKGQNQQEQSKKPYKSYNNKGKNFRHKNRQKKWYFRFIFFVKRCIILS